MKQWLIRMTIKYLLRSSWFKAWETSLLKKYQELKLKGMANKGGGEGCR